MREWDKRNWVTFNLNEDNLSVEHRAGSTHPGTQERSMCGRLMLSMVSRMFSGLRLSQPPDGKHTQHQYYRKEPSERIDHLKHYPI